MNTAMGPDEDAYIERWTEAVMEWLANKGYHDSRWEGLDYKKWYDLDIPPSEAARRIAEGFDAEDREKERAIKEADSIRWSDENDYQDWRKS